VLNEWPTPKNVTEVRQFLGLANYFRKFVLGLSHMCRPLTELTKAGTAWQWGDKEQVAFDSVKQALCSAPTLAMPDTQKDFTVICDASDFGIGAVLMQDGHPVAYSSKLLNAAQRNYTVSDRELLAVVEALKQWRCYLGDRHFKVVTDHSPLTHFATKRDLQGRQARWAEVLAMYSFSWEYRPGRINVADPFSRNPAHKPDVVLAAMASGKPSDKVLQAQRAAVLPASSPRNLPHAPQNERDLRRASTPAGADTSGKPAIDTGVALSQLEKAVSAGYKFDPIFQDPKRNRKFKNLHGLWFDAKGRIMVPNHADLREQVMAAHHANPFSGHQGRIRTKDLISRTYWWEGIAKDVQAYVAACHECQINKPGHQQPQGLLQPLQVPERPWSSISVDFVTGLPEVGVNKWDSIAVFVDRLTKMVHYVPCREAMSAAGFAQVFLENVFRLHGLPLHIVSDRDPRFTSVFWHEVTAALQMARGFSTAFHPQTDGQTERMNRTMEEMLRHFITPLQGDWVAALPMLEFAYNNSKHAATQSTPFRMYTGLDPLHPSSGPAERTYRVPSAEVFVNKMAAELKRAKQCILDAQSKMKTQADKRRRDVVFTEGDMVLLSTKNLKLRGNTPRKLLPRYIGPYRVEGLVGKVACKLALPEHMRMHNVFHVSLLSKYVSDGKLHPLPPHVVDGELEYEVEAITAHEVVKGGKSKKGQPHKPQVRFLTAWKGYGREHDSWEPGEALEHTEALEQYLRSVAKRGGQLPPGYTPEGDEPPKPQVTKRPRTQTQPLVPVAEGEDEGEDPPPAAALAPHKRRRRVRFQLGDG
jgi:RNase H-like domain found in reverse transcriptase/Integrase zinc binding domain/Chromo (CHRromatin Organisation MOdifier) domain